MRLFNTFLLTDAVALSPFLVLSLPHVRTMQNRLKCTYQHAHTLITPLPAAEALRPSGFSECHYAGPGCFSRPPCPVFHASGLASELSLVSLHISLWQRLCGHYALRSGPECFVCLSTPLSCAPGLDNELHLVHPRISAPVAEALGVASRRRLMLAASADCLALGLAGAGGAVEAFGQSEALTTRLRHIIQVVTLGVAKYPH